jgi:putative flavoprotein involved in K+ transport
MSMTELVDFFERYAASFHAPIETGTSVLATERDNEHFKIETSRGQWHARHVVIATGYNDLSFVPPQARHLLRRIVQIVPTQYRNPAQLPAGGVLVVGASATGIQLADEIHASGRPVTLSVGRHQRLPRTYRGRDILWWLDAMGVFDATTENVFDAHTSRSQPSLQLIGRAGRSLDVAILQQRGVRVLGRLVSAEQERVSFGDDLIATTSSSDVKLAQVLLRIDAFISGMSPDTVAPPEPFEPIWPSVLCATKTTIDLRAAGIETVLWATGFARRYPWLRVPVFDEHGEIRHRGGITPVPGLFVLGMHFQRSRKSAFIDGVGEDAALLADRIASRTVFDAAAAS